MNAIISLTPGGRGDPAELFSGLGAHFLNN